MVAYFYAKPGPRRQSGLHSWASNHQVRDPMAKPNYAFARRQRDLAKKQKQEEKRRRKTGAPDAQAGDTPAQVVPPTTTDKTPVA